MGVVSEGGFFVFSTEVFGGVAWSLFPMLMRGVSDIMMGDVPGIGEEFFYGFSLLFGAGCFSGVSVIDFFFSISVSFGEGRGCICFPFL